MANPGGKNSPVHFNGLVQNPPVYGDKARQGDLQRTAPLAGGGAASALNAPRRAGSQAKSGSTPVAAPVSSPSPGPQPTYRAQLAQTWAEIAAVPGASPLVQQLAQEAQIG